MSKKINLPTGKKNTTIPSKRPPEIRDDLDSRMNEEQYFKGNDITHNKKEHRKPERGKKR